MKAAESLLRVRWLPRNTHPENVNGCAKINHLKSRLLADDGMASVRSYGQMRPHFDGSARRLRTNPGDLPVFLNQVGDFGLHTDVEVGIGPALFGDKIQEIPLGHQGHEFAMRGEMR